MAFEYPYIVLSTSKRKILRISSVPLASSPSNEKIVFPNDLLACLTTIHVLNFKNVSIGQITQGHIGKKSNFSNRICLCSNNQASEMSGFTEERHEPWRVL